MIYTAKAKIYTEYGEVTMSAILTDEDLADENLTEVSNFCYNVTDVRNKLNPDHDEIEANVEQFFEELYNEHDEGIHYDKLISLKLI